MCNLKMILFVIAALVAQSYAIDGCYDDLGCFTNDPPWSGTEQRPGNAFPDPPEKINTQFYLDTRSEKARTVFNRDMELLRATSFDPQKPVKFIIHGFFQNGETLWMHEMSDNLLAVEDMNVIRVGWFGGSFQINYAQSVQDIRVVAAEVALFINNLKATFNMQSSDFHAIGHSLGAHLSGYLGALVSPKIARITGLDPAGPYFVGTPFEVRLDSTDADFVDVIHSDAQKLTTGLGMGSSDISGHVDFWPNNGLEQPGCDKNLVSTILDPDGIVEGVTNLVACNHIRAVEYFIESIRSSCPFYANPCGGFDQYKSGACLQCPNNKCPRMGYWATIEDVGGSSPNHFLETSYEDDYCQHMTYTKVSLSSYGDSVEGTLHVSLYGVDENSEQRQMSDESVSLDLRPSNSYVYFTNYNTLPADLYRVKLLWEQTEWTATSQHIEAAEICIWINDKQKWYVFRQDQLTKMDELVRYSFYKIAEGDSCNV